jgi:transcriptional regulator with XRE-family HTH domain
LLFFSSFVNRRMATCVFCNLCLLQAGYPMTIHSPSISLSTSSMHDDFALNIKVERRKKGLSQRDVAHLIGVHPSKVSLMEAGKMLPSLRDIAHLSLVYGKSFEEFFYSFVSKAQESIRQRLPSMPQAPKRWLGRFNRQYTVAQIAERLEAKDTDHEAA